MRPHVARRIAAGAGILDLHDLRAERGQQLRTVRPRAPHLEAQYAQTLQRLHASGFLFRSAFGRVFTRSATSNRLAAALVMAG